MPIGKLQYHAPIGSGHYWDGYCGGKRAAKCVAEGVCTPGTTLCCWGTCQPRKELSGKAACFRKGCKIDGEPCSSEDDCCSQPHGYSSRICVDGVCGGKGCLDRGQACQQTSDCCNRMAPGCSEGVCGGPQACCVGLGKKCTRDVECCSQVGNSYQAVACVAGTCVRGNADGTRCDHDSECATGICSRSKCGQCRRDDDNQCLSDDECCDDLVCSYGRCSKPSGNEHKTTKGRRPPKPPTPLPKPLLSAKNGCPKGCTPDAHGYCTTTSSCDTCAGEYPIDCNKLDFCHEWVRDACRRFVKYLSPEVVDEAVYKLLDPDIDCNNRPDEALTMHVTSMTCYSPEVINRCAADSNAKCKFGKDDPGGLCVDVMAALNAVGRQKFESCLAKCTYDAGQQVRECIDQLLIPPKPYEKKH